jgi:peptide chain release factor subunit 1
MPEQKKELSDKEKFKIKKTVKELMSIRGRHTELVTVYVPAGANLQDMISTVRNEQSTAVNIKSKAVRNHVVAALDKIVSSLQYFRATPPNGLAVFCGNVSEKEGGTDIRIWLFEPPEPLRAKLYWCAQEFDTKPLEEMVAEKEVYGIICLDRAEADIALLIGKRIQSLVHMESIVPGKTRAGGQSSVRFARVREGLKQDWFKKIAEAANKIFTERKDVIGILLSGSGPMKEDFNRQELLHAEVKKKIIGIVDTGYTGEQGLEETIIKGSEALKEASVIKEKRLIEKWLVDLQRPGGLAVYGLKPTLNALNGGVMDTLLISEKAEIKYVEYQCGHEKAGLYLEAGQELGLCSQCGQPRLRLEEKDIAEAMEEIATKFGTKLQLVSADTKEGQQFLALGGVGGFLRYRV